MQKAKEDSLIRQLLLFGDLHDLLDLLITPDTVLVIVYVHSLTPSPDLLLLSPMLIQILKF